ncbi:hypothetical protein D3C72_1719880 [compost metagenome]
MLRVRHDLALRRHDQRPCQFGWRRRRADAFRNGDAQLGGGRHIDVAADLACLRNQFQIRQFRQQGPVETAAFAYQYQRVERRQADRQLAQAPRRIAEHFDLVAGKQLEAIEAAHGILVIIEYGNFHGGWPILVRIW